MLYIYILYIIYIYHFQSAFITLLVLLHLMADRIRLISLTLEVRGKRTGNWRYLEQSTFTAPHLVTFLMSSRSLSGLSYISSDIRTWASKVWSLLGKNKPLDQWVFIMENQSLLARRLFCQFFSLLLPCKFLFTNAILLLYLKKQKNKKTRLQQPWSVKRENIPTPTGSWPASSPRKDISFSVMLPISLGRSHLFSCSPVLPNLASSCLNCLYLSLPFQKNLISDIPLQAPHLFYYCHWYQPLLAGLIIKIVIFFIHTHTPLLSEWEKVWMPALQDVLLWSLFVILASFQEPGGSVLMFTINALMGTGFA